MNNLWQFLNIDIDLINDKPKIIIASESVKRDILKYQFDNKQVNNIKIVSAKELEHLLLMQIDVLSAKVHIINNYDISIHEIKDIVQNIINIDVNADYKEPKFKLLRDIKTDLINNSIIKNNGLLVDKYHKYQFIVIDSINNRNILEILKSLDDTLYYQNINKEISTLDVFESKNIYDEVVFVINKIFELLNNGISINDIFVYYPTTDYQIIFQTLIKKYGIDIADINSNYLYSYDVAKKIVEDLYNKQFDESLTKYLNINNQDVLNQVINILNQYDLSNYHSIKLIEEELKDKRFKNSKSSLKVQLLDLSNRIINFNDKNIFILGFNQTLIPNVIKDNGYLSDNLKSRINLITTIEMNNNHKNLLKELISQSENLTISYSLNHLSKKYQISSFLNDYQLNIRDVNKGIKKSFVKDLNRVSFFKSKEQLDKYNFIGEQYLLYNNLYKEKTYNNKFSNIKSQHQLQEISNTKLKIFFECSYKFYLKYVLFLRKEKFNDSKTLIGNYSHFILEEVIKLKIKNNQIKDFVALKTNDYINNNELSDSQIYYINKQSYALIFLLENLLIEIELRGYNDNILCELEMSKSIDGISLVGKADLILEKISNDDLFIEIYDYKTSNNDVKLDLIKYGFDMQNIIYYILLKEKYEVEGNYYINGFYKQKISSGVLKDNDELIDQFTIKGFSDNKDRVKFKRTVKKITDIDLYELERVVNQNISDMIEDVHSNKFDINPKIYQTHNKSCSHCEYFEICNKKINDYTYLK